jgi:hypothetical protein
MNYNDFLEKMAKSAFLSPLDAWHVALEVYENIYTLTSEVFLFALILYKVLAKKSRLSRKLLVHRVIKTIARDREGWRFAASFVQT